jgi:hypothetical protein
LEQDSLVSAHAGAVIPLLVGLMLDACKIIDLSVSVAELDNECVIRLQCGRRHEGHWRRLDRTIERAPYAKDSTAEMLHIFLFSDTLGEFTSKTFGDSVGMIHMYEMDWLLLIGPVCFANAMSDDGHVLSVHKVLQ